MPMCTQFRDQTGEPVKLPHGWGLWHVQMAYIAIALEAGYEIKDAGDVYDEPIWPIIKQTAKEKGEYTFREAHTFEDPSDGEILKIEPGWKYLEWYQ